MNIFDIVLIIVFVSSIIIGFGRGFVREVISILSLIAAIIVGILFSNQLATALTNSASVQHLIGKSSDAIGMSAAQPASYIAIGISFFLLFIGTLLIGAIVGYLLNSIFQFGVLGAGNRLFGAIFGFIRGLIFAIILVFILQLTPLSEETWWKESRFVNAFKPETAWLNKIISPVLADVQAKVGKKLDDLSNKNAKDSSNPNTK